MHEYLLYEHHPEQIDVQSKFLHETDTQFNVTYSIT